ncbi:hypothetical protein F0U59_04565 [Archangium gephyra]|nr:hypothetical protein F0U59_04565 [Archangium gephyra]
MAGKTTTRLMLAGLLAGSVALGAGCTRAEAGPRPQDLLQQPQQQQGEGTTTQDQTGTGGAGDTNTQQQDEGTPQDDVLNEPGTGGRVGPGGSDPGSTDEDILDEPGTGGAGSTGQDDVRDEDEGVLQPGMNDEGLDHNEGQVDEDTLSPPGARPQPQE